MENFKTQLKKAKDNNIDILGVSCAQAVDDNIAGLTDDEFEKITYFIYDLVLKSDAPLNDVIQILSDGMGDGDIKLEMFYSLDGIQFITKYINYRM